jgi:hypothetical protein
MNYRQGLFVAVCVASSGCAAVLGLDEFKEGGAGGGSSSSSETSSGSSTASGSSTTSSTTGTGGGCGAGTTDCGGTCAALASDPLNCGKCNNACDPTHPGAAACVSSMCQACAAGTADCDGLGVNACESDLSSDKKNCGACGHTCAGSCSAGHCQPSILLAMQPFINSMVLQGSKLYLGTNANKLVVVSTDGSGVKDIASDDSQFAPLALDASYAYWVASTGTDLRIARSSLGGGGVVETVGTLPQGASPNALAVDASGVYFTDGTANKVEKYDFMMSAFQDVATSQSFAGQALIVGSDLFWTTNSPTSLTKKTLPGGSPAVLCSKSAVGQLIASSTDLFFNGEMGISTIPINGANPQNCPKVLTNKTGTSLATDGVTVYWSDNVDATIKSVPVGGGAVTTVSTTFGTTIGLAVDDKYLYWQIKMGLNIMKLEKNP